MQIAQKNIVFRIVLLMGMFLSYSIYFQHSNYSAIIEVTSENNSTSNWLSSDSEIHEDDQITNKTEINSDCIDDDHPTGLLISGQLLQPSFTIWQPPKIS